MLRSRLRLCPLVQLVLKKCKAAESLAYSTPPPVRLSSLSELRSHVSSENHPAIISPTKDAESSSSMEDFVRLFNGWDPWALADNDGIVTVPLRKARGRVFGRIDNLPVGLGIYEDCVRPDLNLYEFAQHVDPNMKKSFPPHEDDTDYEDEDDHNDLLWRRPAHWEYLKPYQYYLANLPLETLPIVSRKSKGALLRLLQEAFGPGKEDFSDIIVKPSPYLYIGTDNQKTPLHFDPTGNLVVCLRGSKTIDLMPPGVYRRLKPSGGWTGYLASRFTRSLPAVYATFDYWCPLGDNHDNMDLLYRAHRHRVELQPGEALWMPPCWWHAAQGSKDTNAILTVGTVPTWRGVEARGK